MSESLFMVGLLIQAYLTNPNSCSILIKQTKQVCRFALSASVGRVIEGEFIRTRTPAAKGEDLIAISCSQCNAQNRAEAKFCSTCEAPLTPIGTEGAKSFLADASKAVDQRVGRPLGSLLLGLICLIYLINPTGGVVEFLPDVLPVVGNLDEGLATIGLVIALNNLGLISLENGRINFEGWTQLISSLRRQKPK